MNKKVMAIAVAGALAAPGLAMAQTSTVQIGGLVQILYFQHKPDNPLLAQSADTMRDSESNFQVRGEERLGGGLSVWFQCESSMAGIVAGGVSSGFCTRNSGIGFKGSWGNAFVGNWDMPQKNITNLARGWWGANNALNGGIGFTLMNAGPSGVANGGVTSATQVVSAGSLTGVPTVTSLPANTPAGFFRRQANSVNYHSPSWSGFSFQGAFSASNEQSQLPEANALSPRLWSLGGQYSSGPLTVGLGYERHEDYNPGGIGPLNNVAAGGVGAVPSGAAGSAYQGGSDTQWNLMMGYRFGAFNIRGMYLQTDYDVTSAMTADTDAWAIFADWAISGPHTLRLQYYKQDDIGGNSTLNIGSFRAPMPGGVAKTSTGVKGIGLAYSYAFSKRTEVSVVYNKLDNDLNSNFSLGVAAALSGNSQKAIGAQIRHRF